MKELKDNISSYLVSQTGILPGMIRRYPPIKTRITAWLVGEKPVLIIGGEPGSGKSLLMGELALRHSELVQLYPELQSSLVLISYDRVHYLFLKRLAERGVGSTNNFLPEGETHPEARKVITKILRDILLFCVLHFPRNARIILEAPLIDHRGEALVDDLSAWGSPMQVLIIHSSAMQSQVLQQERRYTCEMSAQPLAIRQIHEALLQRRGITSRYQQAQDYELTRSWEQWLDNREGLVLSWDPADDEGGFEHTKKALKANDIPQSPLAPKVINKYTSCLIEVVLEMIPNLEEFAVEVQAYR